MQKILFFLLFYIISNVFCEKNILLCESVNKDDDHISIIDYMKEDSCEKPKVKLSYNNEINKTGWAYLDVKIIENSMSLADQGYYAGYAEGHATRNLIKLHIQNMIDPYCKGNSVYCARLAKHLQKNYIWMKNQIEKHSDSYWQQVNLTLNQIHGLMDAYDGTRRRNLPVEKIVSHPIYLLQWLGDFMDLEKKFGKNDGPIKTSRTHCSAIVKILPDYSDILFSHVTWFTYSSMLRIQKKFSFHTMEPGHTYSFSGYPGTVNSIDDFLINSAKLAIFETTIEVHDEKLYKLMIPESVPTFMRTQVATRVAGNGSFWAKTFSKHNSGTYNNQFVILDYKLFQKGEKTQSLGLLYVLEQMPGMIVQNDKTHQLFETTYWPSYNRPYFQDIFKISGSAKMQKEFGDWYSYDHAPRANIFRRDHHFVVDMWTLIQLMRSNNYKTDKFSRCPECNPPYSAESAIAARSELNDPNGTYPIADRGFIDMGATDMKATNSKLVESFEFTAISGPTNNPTPIFNWDISPLRHDVPHYGQPTIWRFPAITHKWNKWSDNQNINDKKKQFKFARNIFKWFYPSNFIF